MVNPALGKAIIDLFPPRERGTAMGIKQMGLTLGGVVSAIVLPPIATSFGWRTAIATCGIIVALPVALTWRPLGRLQVQPRTGMPASSASGAGARGGWSWARRPAPLVFFATGMDLE